VFQDESPLHPGVFSRKVAATKIKGEEALWGSLSLNRAVDLVHTPSSRTGQFTDPKGIEREN